MKSLVIDTTSSTSYLILSDNGKKIEKKIEKSQNLSKNFHLELKSFLENNNVSIDEITYLACSVGPGSFSSLRVGASVAKTISFLRKIPLVGYISLLAYVPDNDGKYIITMSAKSHGIYILKVEKINGFIFYNEAELINISRLERYKNYSIVSDDDNLILQIMEKTSGFNFINQRFNSSSITHITNDLYEKKSYSNYNLNLLYLSGPNWQSEQDLEISKTVNEKF